MHLKRFMPDKHLSKNICLELVAVFWFKNRTLMAAMPFGIIWGSFDSEMNWLSFSLRSPRNCWVSLQSWQISASVSRQLPDCWVFWALHVKHYWSSYKWFLPSANWRHKVGCFISNPQKRPPKEICVLTYAMILWHNTKHHPSNMLCIQAPSTCKRQLLALHSDSAIPLWTFPCYWSLDGFWAVIVWQNI